MMKAFKYALIGALFGLSSCFIILTISLLQLPNEAVTGEDLLLHLLISLFLGIACGLSSLIFEIERWSFIVKLAIHYVVILVLVLVSGAIGNWYANPLESPRGFMLFIAIQLFVYIIIFIIAYWINVKEVKEINEKLSKR